MAYRVRLTDRVHLHCTTRLPKLHGFVAGIIAFLQVDPSAASVAFPVIAGEDYRTIVFADGRGFLDHEVFEEQQLVVIDELTWLT